MVRVCVLVRGMHYVIVGPHKVGSTNRGDVKISLCLGKSLTKSSLLISVRSMPQYQESDTD